MSGTINVRGKLDSKGRLVIPETLRRRVGLRKGYRVSMKVKDRSIVIRRSVNPEEFIKQFEGFLKEGSLVKSSDPLKLKEIWTES